MRDQAAFVVLEQALRYVRERDVGGFARTFARDGVVELPFPLPGMSSRQSGGREEVRRVLAPVWRAREASGRRADRDEPLVVHETREPELVVIEFDLHGVEASGTPYRLSYVHVVPVRDGRVAPLRERIDAVAIHERLRAAELERNKALVRRELDGRAEQYLSGRAGAEFTIDTLVAEGDLVAARSTLHRTEAGEKVVSSGMAFFRVREGRIFERWTAYPGVGT